MRLTFLSLVVASFVFFTDGAWASVPEDVRSSTAVLARPGAEVSGWKLAHAVYRNASMRPTTLDENEVRALVEDSGSELRRAPVATLVRYGEQKKLRALVVVAVSETGETRAKLLRIGRGEFERDDYFAASDGSWTDTVRSIDTRLQLASEPTNAVFYRSPWFWGAVGAAAITVLAVVAIGTSSSNNGVHVAMRTP